MSSSSVTEQIKTEGSHRRNLILALLVVAQFVVVLDFSIVQIALPTIRAQLGVSLANLQWIVSAYGLTFAGFLMLSGRASDLYGRRRLFILGLTLFAVSSLAGGLAPSELVLIVARAIQGIGAAIASATGLSLVISIFGPIGQLNRALSVFTAVSSAAFTAGIILGGVLTESLGWRSIFFINVPIGIVAAGLAPKFLTESRGQLASKHLDLPGAISVTAGLMLLVYALTGIANGGLMSLQTLLLLGVSVLVLVGFLIIEYRSKAPLMPLGFLRRGTVFNANAIGLLTNSALSGMIFMMTIYLQQVQGYSALTTALAFIPASLIFFVGGGFIAARLITRIGMKPVLVGSNVLIMVGLLLLTRLSVGESYFSGLLPAILVVAAGGAIGYTAFNIAAVSGAKRGEEGLASGLVNTSAQVGGPIGLAIVVSVVGIVTQSLGGGASAASVLVTGFQYAFVAATILSGIAVLMALAIRRQKQVTTQEQVATSGMTDGSVPRPTSSPMIAPKA